jgi:hypothetical protein
LAEALAARAVHRSTTQAVRDLASVIATREMVGRPVPARQSAPLAKRAPFTTPSGVTKARSFIPATEGIKK